MRSKILGKLFEAYREPGALTFASRWMHKHGKLLIGDPASKFKDRAIEEELITSYYFTKDDRRINKCQDITRWRFDSMFVNAYRRYEERYVAVGASAGAFALCLIAVLALIPINGAKWGVDAIAGVGCESYIEKVRSGEIPSEEVDLARARKCAAKEAGGSP